MNHINLRIGSTVMFQRNDGTVDTLCSLPCCLWWKFQSNSCLALPCLALSHHQVNHDDSVWMRRRCHHQAEMSCPLNAGLAMLGRIQCSPCHAYQMMFVSIYCTFHVYCPTFPPKLAYFVFAQIFCLSSYFHLFFSKFSCVFLVFSHFFPPHVLPKWAVDCGLRHKTFPFPRGSFKKKIEGKGPIFPQVSPGFMLQMVL